jgi:hypothetical protein
MSPSESKPVRDERNALMPDPGTDMDEHVRQTAGVITTWIAKSPVPRRRRITTSVPTGRTDPGPAQRGSPGYTRFSP